MNTTDPQYALDLERWDLEMREKPLLERYFERILPDTTSPDWLIQDHFRVFRHANSVALLFLGPSHPWAKATKPTRIEKCEPSKQAHGTLLYHCYYETEVKEFKVPCAVMDVLDQNEAWFERDATSDYVAVIKWPLPSLKERKKRKGRK